MTAISLLTIEGVIQSPEYHIDCRLEALSSRIPTPQIFKVNTTYDFDQSVHIRENFENLATSEESSFWKQRMIIDMMASKNIFSIAFIPRSFGECQVLFMQKINLLPEITGFVAPYLSDEDQKELGAIATITDCRELDADDESINQSIQGWEHCSSDLKPILAHFLQDHSTIFLALTCRGHHGKLVSRGWLKA